ncbi:MAG: type II secretion system protein GspF, partial [Bdellovibrionales bacterium]|nr:type II secretion system protein GspF [Bdellovibrionales bacterium]
MPSYEYKGLNKLGKNVKGLVEAENLRTAQLRLKKDGIFVVEIKNKRTKQKKSKGGGGGRA